MQLTRGYSSDAAISPFLPMRRTVAKAERAGLSVGDYLDRYSAEPGATAATVEAMLRLGGLEKGVERVCEIGPGSGRYAAPVLTALQPRSYEVYETAADWIRYLRKEFPQLTVQPADGHTLRHTATESVDLVHSHKLFNYIPFVATLGYLAEMARVVRPGGVVAFDVMTEDCLNDAATTTWLDHPDRGIIYSLTPRRWALDFLARRGLDLLGNHFVPLSGMRTELLVFRRR
ncbi:class I SAM-dependent methyltransferase [Kribbella lupini]|uniref:class I SAM-dependent methyltransferase n=1 Tax=Kribbella lupini TaxID=291602 RepID=UPI0031DA9200